MCTVMSGTSELPIVLDLDSDEVSHMYVCMYACMYVCMYVYMYVCMYMYVCVYVCVCM